MRLRAATCVFLVGGLLLPLTAQDARDMVRRAVEQSGQNSNASLRYTYLERQEVRELDRSGQVKKRTIQTWDVTPLEGSPYRRLVARNDQPLPPEERKAEEEKLRWSNEQRRNETPEQRSQRLADWQRRQERQREPIKELPDAFNFTIAREDSIDGHSFFVIDALPKPGYKPKSRFAGFFPRVKLRLWIDKNDYQGARVEMETLDTVSFGGLLVRVSKGTRLVIELTRVNDEVWLPKHVSLTASARILLLKGITRDLDYTYSGYKKFEVDSRVVAVSEQP